jgi:hypothetical protein
MLSQKYVAQHLVLKLNIQKAKWAHQLALTTDGQASDKHNYNFCPMFISGHIFLFIEILTENINARKS